MSTSEIESLKQLINEQFKTLRAEIRGENQVINTRLNELEKEHQHDRVNLYKVKELQDKCPVHNPSTFKAYFVGLLIINLGFVAGAIFAIQRILL